MQCEICEEEFKIITWKHLWFKHDMKIEEYDSIYGKQKHGMTKTTPESVAKTSEKNKGNIPWNKGLTKHDHPSIMRLSMGRLGENNPVHKIKDKEAWKRNVKKGVAGYIKSIKGKTLEEIYGPKRAKEIRKNLCIGSRKRPKTAGHHVPHSEETKQKLREATTRQMANNTKDFVSKLQLNFYELVKTEFPDQDFVLQHNFKFYVIDVAIPKLKIAIEVDGDFWHVNESKGYTIKYDCQKKNKANDKRKNSFILNRGWSLIRFWESDINEDIDSCLLRLENFIKDVKSGLRTD